LQPRAFVEALKSVERYNNPSSLCQRERCETDSSFTNTTDWALSPLKDEKTPSFSVNTDTNVFYDFSSGKGGNIISFICQHNRCGKRKAIEILREYAGESGSGVRTRRMAATKVAKRYIRHEQKSKQSKAEILPDDYMERYEKSADKLAIWESEGISQASLEKFQVRYDPFSDRIVYPIRAPNGNIINVSGRTIDPEWKEKGFSSYESSLAAGFLR
jgi:DNA primase